MEKIIAPNNTYAYRRTLAGGVALVTDAYDAAHSETGSVTRYLLKDHLGSVSVLVDNLGTMVQEMSYDPWGQRRNAADWQALSSLSLTSFDSSMTRRGFTGHEMVDTVGIIHMNGRIYDPKLGRFMQADPVIQFPDYSQSRNRYSYVLNNPLNATDPTGYFIGKLFKKIFRGLNKVFGDFAPFLGIALLAVPGINAWVTSSWINAFQFGFATGGIATGSLRGALFGGISAAAFYGIGEHFSAVTGLAEGGVGHILTHGVAGGILAELQGGQFGHGFLAAGLPKAVMGRFRYDDLSAPAVMGRTAIAATVGGTISRITGGKFANGAVTSAMAQLFNAETHQRKFVNPTGKGVRGCDSQGCGEFGAEREGRKHLGTDYISEPGQDVVAIDSGKVARLPSGGHDGIVVGDDQGISYKILYLNVDKSLKVGTPVQAGQVLGIAQDITGRYPGITNHVHVKLRVNYKVVNPEDYIEAP